MRRWGGDITSAQAAGSGEHLPFVVVQRDGLIYDHKKKKHGPMGVGGFLTQVAFVSPGRTHLIPHVVPDSCKVVFCSRFCWFTI